MSDNLPHMDYRQHRRARRLVHECCNYCLLYTSKTAAQRERLLDALTQLADTDPLLRCEVDSITHEITPRTPPP